MEKMRYIYNIGIAIILSCLIACSDSGDDPIIDMPEGGSCTLSLQVGAAGSSLTKAGDDDNALEGEFMHELCVFIVDASGNIEKKLMTEDGQVTGSFSDGSAYLWEHDGLVLSSGEKTIYAFANWNTAENEDWSAIIAKKERDPLSDADLNEIVIDDPAGKINIEDGKYIPMSVKQEINLAVSQTVRVELIRLVGRVDVTVNNQRAETITVTKFSMENLPDKVSLMDGGLVSAVSYNQSYTVDLNNIEVSTTRDGTEGTPIVHFYINEVESDCAFPISLVTESHGTFSGSTSSRQIGRNQILPLQLNISENGLNLMINAYVAPIGGYPVPVYVNYPLGEDDMVNTVYQAKLPEGCSFQVSATLTNGSESISGTCELKLRGGNSSNNISVDGSWAHVTSLEGVETTILDVDFTSDDQTRNAQCQLQITTEKLTDLDKYNIQTTGLYLRSWCAAPRWYEPINLMIEQ